MNWYVDYDPEAKSDLPFNYLNVQYVRQMRFRAILKIKRETESW